MTNQNPKSANIELEQVQDVTPHNKALYEAGKKLLLDSVDIGREFCKFMTTTSLGAIPTYLVLLKLVLPNNYSLSLRSEIVFLVPPFLFLVSAAVFVLGYFPKKGTLCLDLPSDFGQIPNPYISMAASIACPDGKLIARTTRALGETHRASLAKCVALCLCALPGDRQFLT